MVEGFDRVMGEGGGFGGTRDEANRARHPHNDQEQAKANKSRRASGQRTHERVDVGESGLWMTGGDAWFCGNATESKKAMCRKQDGCTGSRVCWWSER